MMTVLTALVGPEMAASPVAAWLLLGLIGYILVLLLIACGLIGLTIHLHRSNERKAQTWKTLETAWEPLLNQALSGGLSSEAVHAEIGPEQGMYFVDFLTRYALRLSGNSRGVLEQLAAPWLPRLAERLAEGDDEQRARAVFTLSTLAPGPYRIVIARALDDAVPLVAMLAARSLAEKHASEYLELVLRHLDRFRAWSPGYLTSMLVQLGKSEPERLRRALAEGAHPVWIQTVVLRALSELNDLESVPVATELLKADPDPELQAAALDLLARLGFGQHKQLVRDKCTHPHFVIRLHALKALNRLGDPSDEALFRSLLEDESQWIAIQAAYGLKAIESFEVLESLAESEHPRAELAQQVLYDFDSEKALLASARGQGFVRRVPAWIRTALRRQSSLAWQRVQRVLFHPETHPDVRLAIAAALTPEAAGFLQPAILRQLDQQDAERAYLYRALYQLGPQTSLETLAAHFFSSSDEAGRLEILDLLLQQQTPVTRRFVRELQTQLTASAQFSARLHESIQEKMTRFSALPT